MYIVRSCKFSVAAVISTPRIYSTARCSGGLAMASYSKGLRARRGATGGGAQGALAPPPVGEFGYFSSGMAIGHMTMFHSI